MRRLRSSLTPLVPFFLMSVAFSAQACSGASGTPPDDNPGFDTGVGDASSTEGGSDTSSTGDSSKDTGGGFDVAAEDTAVPVDSAPPLEAGPGGIIPGCGMDTDGDGIIDAIEGKGATGGDTDTDKDGTPDWKDLDSDEDSIPDIVEWPGGGCETSPFSELNDADGDGKPNFQDLDSDGNGLVDKSEACPPASMPGAPAGCFGGKPADFDGDGVGDWLDFDNDHDSAKTDKTIGLADKYELTDAAGTYVGLVDTDSDKVFDLWDRDSDGDFILDFEDGVTDPDKDGKANFRDLDSEADGVGDACEARAKATPGVSDYALPLLDTNGNGIFDFVDKDSDGDLLVDGSEDLNGNCIVDTAETDRIKADTDGDGVSDMVEVGLGGVACAKDPSCTPGKLGKFYFVVPYSKDGSAAPSPASSILALSTTLNKGDVGFVVDTTGSMTGEINNLKSSLSATIIPALKAKIPSLGIGVAGHDDYPYSSGCGWLGSCTADYGSGADLPYYNTSPAGFITTDTATAQAAANSLSIHNGDDGPEAQIPGLFHTVAGDALSWPGGSVGADNGTPGSTFGALHFRSDALPIVVEISDADFHNGKRALTSGGGSYDGAFQNTYSFGAPTSDDLVAKLNTLGAKFIGVAAENGGRLSGGPGGNPYGYEAYISDKTGSNAPPGAFGGSCKTGIGGAAVAADGPGGSCRLVFSINTDGTGLGTSIVDGVLAILASIKFDVHVEAYNDAGSGAVDVVTDFMTKVEPRPTGGTDPVTGATCVTFPASQLADNFHTPKAIPGAGDIQETIKQVNPGSYYCFDVVPKPNTVIPATTSVQTYKAWLKVVAVKPTGGTFALGTDREVLFLIPPVIN